jgi:hypothetical protein
METISSRNKTKVANNYMDLRWALQQKNEWQWSMVQVSKSLKKTFDTLNNLRCLQYGWGVAVDLVTRKDNIAFSEALPEQDFYC